MSQRVHDSERWRCQEEHPPGPRFERGHRGDEQGSRDDHPLSQTDAREVRPCGGHEQRAAQPHGDDHAPAGLEHDRPVGVPGQGEVGQPEVQVDQPEHCQEGVEST